MATTWLCWAGPSRRRRGPTVGRRRPLPSSTGEPGAVPLVPDGGPPVAAAKLDASAPIALDISPPTSRRASSLKRRPTLQSTSSAGHRASWKLQYRDFVPPVSTSLLTNLGSAGAAVCVDNSDPFQ